MSNEKFNVGSAGAVAETVNITGKYAAGRDLEVNIGQYFGADFKPKKFLTSLPPRPINHVRRENIETQISSALKEHEYFHIRGIFGSGKTVSLEEYVHRNQERFDHIAWITGSSNIQTCLLGQLRPERVGIGYGNTQSLEDRFNNLMLALQNIGGNNLLVLDHFNDPDELLLYRAKLNLPTNWKVIVTTRANIPEVHNIKVGRMTIEKGIELFNGFYKGEADPAVISELVTALDGYAINIQICAKSVQNNYSTKGKNALREMLELQTARKEKQNKDPQSDSEESELFKQLKDALKQSNLTELEEERACLKLFCLLPVGEYDVNELTDLFRISESNINHFVDSLRRLVSLGWLESNDTKLYSLNSVIGRLLVQEMPPDNKEIKTVLNSVLGKVLNQRFTTVIDSLELFPKLEVLEKHIEKGSLDEARYHNAYGMLLLKAGDFTKGLNSFRKAKDILTPMVPQQVSIRRGEKGHGFPPERVFLSQIHNNIAISLSRQGQTIDATAAQIDAIELMRGCPPWYELQLSNYYDNAAVLCLNLNQPDSAKVAEQYCMLSLNIKEANRDTPLVNLALNLNNLSQVRMMQKDYEGALKYVDRAIEVMKKASGKDTKHSLTLEINKGIILQNLDRLTDPENHNRDLISRLTNVLGEDHPEVASQLINQGVLLYKKNNLEEARMHLEKGLNFLQGRVTDSDKFVSSALYHLGLVSNREKKYDEAALLLNRLLVTQLSTYGRNNYHVAFTYSNLAAVYMNDKDVEKADENFRTSLEIYEELGLDDSPVVELLLTNMRRHFKLQKRYQKSFRVAQKLVAIQKKMYGEDNPKLKKSVYQMKAIEGRWMKQRLFRRFRSFFGIKPKIT